MFCTSSWAKSTMSCLKNLLVCTRLVHKHRGVYGLSSTLSTTHLSLVFPSRLYSPTVSIIPSPSPMTMSCHTQIHSHSTHTATGRLGSGVCSNHALQSRRGVIAIGNIFRTYSTGPEKDQNPVVQGKVVGVPNPINWIRNKLSLYLIRRYMDSNFTYEEFTAGAKQATIIVMSHLSRKDFDGMTDLVAPEVIESLKEFTADWVTKQWEAVSIGEEDVQFVAPKVASIKPEDDKYRLAIELLVVAFKSTSADASLVEVTTQFERMYTANKVTEWTVSNIGPLKIRTYNVKDGQLR